MRKSSVIWIHRLTAEFEVPEALADPLAFRIEVYGRSSDLGGPHSFRLRVWRYESFRLQALGETAGKDSFEYTCLVLDTTFDGLELVASSAEEALRSAQRQILEQLGLTDERG